MTGSLQQLTGESLTTLPVEELERITSANMRLQSALATERHADIASAESDLCFWLRGAVLALIRAAVAQNIPDLARELTGWAERGIPRNRRQEVIDLITQ